MEQHSGKRFSLFEFNNLETNDEKKYELIDGIVLMSPRPNYKHQEVMGNLYLQLANYFKGKNCKAFTEAEVEFNDNVLIPDISVICGLDNSNIQRYRKAPEIVIEIISPGSQYTDSFTKLYKYELFGVKEYWIANPKTETITVYNYKNETITDYNKNEKLVSAVFDGLIINMSDVFI